MYKWHKLPTLLQWWIKFYWGCGIKSLLSFLFLLPFLTRYLLTYLKFGFNLRSTLTMKMKYAQSCLTLQSHGQRSWKGYSPWGHKRVGNDLMSKQQQQFKEKADIFSMLISFSQIFLLWYYEIVQQFKKFWDSNCVNITTLWIF